MSDLLALRDAQIDRCTCGAWRWRGRCQTCETAWGTSESEKEDVA